MADENDVTGQQTADEAAAAATAAAAAAEAAKAGNPPPPSDDPFKALGLTDEQKDIREWITKTGFKGPADIAKSAYEQQKLLGNSIRIPDDKATDEERSAYLDKLGRPKEAKDYSFKPPEDFPKEVPYDGDRADSFKSLAHSIGLSAKQATAIHDWAAVNAANDFKGFQSGDAEKQMQTAKDETAKLVKAWGPLDGDQAKTNLAFADRALREAGGDAALAEFQRVGLIGKEGKVVQSAPIAMMLAKMGTALFTEDQVLKGNPDRLENPFADGKSFNVSAQMKVFKDDPALALSYIAAAGKKPGDFGLKG